jgi:hypothetical protein
LKNYLKLLGEKYRSTELCKGNKTVPKTVATTRTEDRHRQSIKTSTAI